MVSSIVTGSDTTIIITFSENIVASDISNGLSQFTLQSNGANDETPSAVTIANNQATLTVNSIGNGNKILTLSYTKVNTANRFLTDTAGTPNALQSFSSKSVTNTRDTTAPVVYSTAYRDICSRTWRH